MSRQEKLSADEVIVAIQQLTPAEKRKVQRRLPELFELEGQAATPEHRKPQPPAAQYNFTKARKLLRGVKGNLSADVVAEREDRF